MILDRIRQLESRAELARNDGSLKQDLKKAEGVRGRVSILGRLLEKVTAAYKEISAVKPIECAAVLTDLRSLREGIAQMTAQSRTQPLFGATPVFAQSLMLQEKMANAAEKSLEEIWTTYRKDQQESFVDRDFLEILGRSGLDVEALLGRCFLSLRTIGREDTPTSRRYRAPPGCDRRTAQCGGGPLRSCSRGTGDILSASRHPGRRTISGTHSRGPSVP